MSLFFGCLMAVWSFAYLSVYLSVCLSVLVSCCVSDLAFFTPVCLFYYDASGCALI